MNRFLCSLVFVLSFFGAHAQSQSSLEEIQTLAQKVDSLEHELSYLRLTYELSSLNSDILMFKNEIYTKSVEIQLQLYNRNFNSELGDAYRRYYESCQYRKQSFTELIEAKKKFFILKVMTYPYTESELGMFKTSYSVINDAYDVLEDSMDFLKVTIDAYNEHL